MDTDAELVTPSGHILTANGAFYIFKAVFYLILFYNMAGYQCPRCSQHNTRNSVRCQARRIKITFCIFPYTNIITEFVVYCGQLAVCAVNRLGRGKTCACNTGRPLGINFLVRVFAFTFIIYPMCACDFVAFGNISL